MKPIARLLVIACVLTGTAACDSDDEKSGAGSGSGSGDASIQWLSTGGSCSDLPEVEANKEQKASLGFFLCNQAHKTFAGEMRCERDMVEVACRG